MNTADIAREILALDLLTLTAHTEQAGDTLDAAQQALRIRESLTLSQVCSVRRNGALVAYALLNPMKTMTPTTRAPAEDTEGIWFVRGFNTHPQHRNAGVMRELMLGVAALARREGVQVLCSHVYKTNRLSMAFHRKLGFSITRENAKGVEFRASVHTLGQSAVLRKRVCASADPTNVTPPLK